MSIPALLLILGESIQSYTLKYDVNCRFSVNSLLEVAIPDFFLKNAQVDTEFCQMFFSP